MAQETNEGIEYLKALRQFSQPQSSIPDAAQPRITSSAQEASPAAHHEGVEKRRSPRYKCEGSAEIREDGCDVRTWATFTDVSLHGCYVEAQATYPVGTSLQMKLEANGICVNTKGCVRVSYPYLGMGIAFVDTTEEERTNLKELLGTISRPSIVMGPGVAPAIPASTPLDAVPLITNPSAAVQALVEFFETRHMLTREEFLATLAKSQTPAAKH